MGSDQESASASPQAPVAESVPVGADFVRADLHVHTYADSVTEPEPDLDAYISAAVANDIRVLAITDHNTAQFVRGAIKAARGKPLLVLPGIEISTNDGHLLALFSQEQLAELDALANPTNLKLTKLSETEQRSSRSMLDLVQEVHSRGGLAIPAHVDAANGVVSRLRQAELAELLTSPALAGLEFATKAALEEWFTDDDPDPDRQVAWKARQNQEELRDRGLARLMSSDAHAPDQVGRDRSSRTLTRLRLDDPNFAAIRNAVMLNPKARCKAEAVLPATYPRILGARFEGGFLDGVEMDFSPNLNCLIGGRGSGKSTALLSIRVALGAKLGPEDEDPDDPDRMPEVTEVRFLDRTGSERLARRERGQPPTEPASNSAIRLRLADLAQDESGRLARGYRETPEVLLDFLDTFIVRHAIDERETELTAALEENAGEISRTTGVTSQIKEREKEHAQLEASLKAATDGKVEAIAQWAGLLAAQAPFLQDLEARLVPEAPESAEELLVDLDAIASEYGVDLSRKPAIDFVDGDTGLRKLLADVEKKRTAIGSKVAKEIAAATKPAQEVLNAWKENQADLEKRLKKRQEELESQGLKVQAGAVRNIANRLNTVKTTLIALRKKEADHSAARKERQRLLFALHENREKLFLLREATLKQITTAANRYSDDLTVRVYFQRSGLNGRWIKWLTDKFGFRKPRVLRLAEQIGPRDFAEALVGDRTPLLALRDQAGEPFFNADMLNVSWKWAEIFKLETMLLPDRPRIEVQRVGSSERQAFDHLSAGQQRSVLLGLLLCAERDEPLVLDQPEDHLDGQYIARAVVRHLEAAKEHRQVLIATHSANLTVLGDAELVIPMTVTADGRGEPYKVGSVDRDETRDQVCLLLEGGVEAYKKRGERYGFRFK